MTSINYNDLIERALYNVIKDALSIMQRNNESGGSIGNHHFFISFLTYFPGVVLSDKLKRKYPNEITIVLQNRFENLEAKESGFSVILSFGGIPETIVIPYQAITVFADPSVKFDLQFKKPLLYSDTNSDSSFINSLAEDLETYNNKKTQASDDTNTDESDEKSNIIDFKSFLSKNKPKQN